MTPDRNPDIADVDIVKRVVQGETELFRHIVTRYQRRVIAMGMRFLHNREASEDYAQEVFIRVYRNLHTFRGESRFYSWLMRIAYHMAIDASASRKRTDSLGDFEPQDGADTPEQQLLRRQAAGAIRDAMKELSPYHAVCIDLYFFFDLRYEEISNMTGYPLNTVKSHVRRAKVKLRQILDDSVSEV